MSAADGSRTANPSTDGVGRLSAPVLPEIGGRVDKYRLLRELGRGGQGTVYLAEDVELGRRVALKVLEGFGATSPEAAARFRREAMTASRLQHPGICAIYEAKVDAPVPFIAMQYVDGQTLARRIALTKERATTGATDATETAPSVWLGFDEATLSDADGAPESTEPPTSSANASALERDAILEIVILFEKTARALAAAHEAGVVHRDVKPGNIMIAKSGDPILLDFGLARRDDPEFESMTKVGEICGTPAYMSPEQLSRRPVTIDARSDVWSLGVALYECLVMRRPFEAPTREGLYLAVLNHDPASPRRLNRRVPADLDVVVMTALEKNRDRRYQTALDFAEELRRVRMNEPIVARPVGPLGRMVRWAAREPAKAALAAVLILTLPSIAGLVTAWAKDRPAVLSARRAAERARREAMLADAAWDLFEGDPARAIDVFRGILAAAPDCDTAIAGEIFGNVQLRRFDRAETSLHENAHRLTAGFGIESLRAAIANGRGHPDEAEKFETQSPPPHTLFDYWAAAQRAFLRGESQVRAGRDADAANEFRRALAYATEASILSGAPRIDLLVMRAHAAGHIAEKDAVIAAIAPLEALWPDDPSAIFWCAFARMNVDDATMREGAVLGFERLIRMRPKDDRAWTNLGTTLGRSGRIAEAQRAFAEAVRLAPRSAEVRKNAALALWETDRARAIEEFEEATKIDPNDAGALSMLGVKLLDIGRADEGLAALKRSLKLAPDDPITLAALGRIQGERGDADDAMKTLERALNLDPKLSSARLDYAAVLRAEGRADDALDELQKALAVEPEMPEALCNLASLLETYGRWPEALDLYRRGDANGKRSRGWSYPSDEWIAKAEGEVRKIDDAARLLDRLLESDAEPETSGERLRCARVLALRGRVQTASDWFAAALEEAPDLAADVRARHRLIAAECAVRAADQTDGKRAATHRVRALAWLRADVDAIEDAHDNDGAPMAALRPFLVRYVTDRALTPVRDAARLARLTAPERGAWVKLWADFDRLIATE